MLINNFTKLFCFMAFCVTPLLASAPQKIVKITSVNNTEFVLTIATAAEISTVNIDGIKRTQVAIPTEGFVGKRGMPNLPAITRLLTFPSDGELHIEVIQDDYVEIELQHPLAPFTLDDNENMNTDYQFDDRVPFPANIVEVGSRQLFRGHRLYPFTINPYQYDRETQKIIHHEEITLSIRFEASTDPSDNESGAQTPAAMTIDTYRFLNALTMNGPQRDDAGAGLPRGGYLIATSFSENQVGEYVERLADWKRACGHQVEIIYSARNITGNGNRFRDEEIETRYDEWDPPLEYACVIAAFDERQLNTDVTYGCLDGNNDHVPEVAVARLGATTQQQVNVVISRVLSYQQEPWIEELDWFNRAGAYAYNVGRSHLPSVDYTINWIAEAERRSGFPEVFWHSADGGNQGMPGNWLRNGLSIHFGRGLNRQQLPNFSNLEWNTMWISTGGGHVPLYLDAIWLNGNPNNPYGPSALSGTGHNPQTTTCNVIIGGMARGLLIDRLPLGWARAFALLMLDYSNIGSWQGFAMEYRVMGEPGQRAWIGAPLMPEVTHEEAITVGQNRFEVTVYDPENETGVPNALVTLTQPGELLTIGLTDENGNCVLTIAEELEDDVLLTVTKESVLPYQAEVEVRENHLFVRGFISELNDEENGNGDGILNPGETVEITIVVENLSEVEDAEDVVGRLSVNSSWLVIDDREFNLGNVDHSEEVEYDEGLTIVLDPSAPENARIGLSIILSSGEMNWISSLSLEIEGADLNLSEIEGGLVFDPEMADLNIILINDGALASPAMIAELVSPSQWIQMINTDAVFPAIEPSETARFAGDPFIINPSPIAPPGLKAPMLVLLRANEDDIPDTISFELQIDTPRESGPNGPDDYGYICFDDTDEAWEQAPEYHWIEIDPNNRNGDFAGEEVPGQRRNEFTTEVDLPFMFQFYGEEYNQITISENGFIAMGSGLENLKQYENFPLDMVINGSFGMIAPYWDDLNIRVNDANIYTYYADEEHIFVVQWQGIGFANDRNRRLTFQVIFIDPEFFPVVSGDGKILIQYKSVSNPYAGWAPRYFSAGICSPDGSMGINYSYGNDYPVPSAPIENQRALLFTTAAEAPRGTIYGTVLDVETEQPMEDVIIETSYGQLAFTDDQGEWEIPDAWGLPFDVTADKQGWNDSTLTGFDLEEGDSIEINFALLYPEFEPTTWNLEYMLDPDHQAELDFSVHNTGNGPLDWNVDRRLFGDANAEPWRHRRSILAGEITEDSRLYGVAFINNQFYISGANIWDDEEGDPEYHPTIYIFNVEGEEIDTLAQPGNNNRGMKDLTFDGELIWGVVSNTVYGMTLEGDVEHSFAAPYNPSSAITWDSDREIFWICGTTSNPVGIDRAGNRIEGMEIDRNQLRIYGLAYFYDDPDDAPLYIFTKEIDTNRQILYKYSFETEDTMYVAYLDAEGGGSPQGSFITNTYDVYSWVFMSISNDAARDRVDIHQIEGRKDWFMLDLQTEEGRIEAESGQLQTDEVMDFILTLDATALPETLFQAELYFSHNADSGIGHITIDLDVIGSLQPLPFTLALPQDGDTLLSAAVDFSWNPAYDPNVDDDVSYELWATQGNNSRSIALPDTSISIHLDSLWNEIDYTQPVGWWVHAIASGDTVECEQRFSFSLDINTLGDDPQLKPYVFKLNAAYPNPFNGMTTISFELNKPNLTSLTVIDLLGREVMVLHRGVLAPGRYTTMWDAQRVSSGVYLIRLESAENIMIKKVLLMK